PTPTAQRDSISSRAPWRILFPVKGSAIKSRCAAAADDVQAPVAKSVAASTSQKVLQANRCIMISRRLREPFCSIDSIACPLFRVGGRNDLGRGKLRRERSRRLPFGIAPQRTVDRSHRRRRDIHHGE